MFNFSRKGTPTIIQADSATLVAASDSTVYQPSTLYVGTTGNVQVVTASGGTAIFYTHPVGYMPVLITKVMSTSTTASNFVILN